VWRSVRPGAALSTAVTWCHAALPLCRAQHRVRLWAAVISDTSQVQNNPVSGFLIETDITVRCHDKCCEGQVATRTAIKHSSMAGWHVLPSFLSYLMCNLTCTHARAHTDTHTHTHIYTHTYIHTHIHICIHTYTHTNTHTHTHTHTYMWKLRFGILKLSEVNTASIFRPRSSAFLVQPAHHPLIITLDAVGEWLLCDQGNSWVRWMRSRVVFCRTSSRSTFLAWRPFSNNKSFGVVPAWCWDNNYRMDVADIVVMDDCGLVND
jgi:hypothetical protein